MSEKYTSLLAVVASIINRSLATGPLIAGHSMHMVMPRLDHYAYAPDSRENARYIAQEFVISLRRDVGDKVQFGKVEPSSRPCYSRVWVAGRVALRLTVTGTIVGDQFMFDCFVRKA